MWEAMVLIVASNPNLKKVLNKQKIKITMTSPTKLDGVENMIKHVAKRQVRHSINRK